MLYREIIAVCSQTHTIHSLQSVTIKRLQLNCCARPAIVQLLRSLAPLLRPVWYQSVSRFIGWQSSWRASDIATAMQVVYSVCSWDCEVGQTHCHVVRVSEGRTVAFFAVRVGATPAGMPTCRTVLVHRPGAHRQRITLLILDINSRWRWVVSVTPRPLYPSPLPDWNSAFIGVKIVNLE